MAGDAAEFFIALGDQVSPNALKIAQSVETMSAAQIKAAATTLRLDAAMSKAQSLRAKAAADTAKSSEALKKSGVASGEAGSAASSLAEGLENVGGSAAQAGGPIGKLQGVLSKLGPEGELVAVALGLITIAVTATVGTLAMLMGKAIEVTQQLGLMSARFIALAGSASGGKAVTDMVLRLGEELPFATEQIGEWASSLQRAGLAGKDLEAATRAVAAAGAINPKGGAQAAEELLSKLAKAGKEAEGLIKGVAEQTKKGTGPLREMGLSLADLGGEAAVAKMSAADLSKAIEKALAKKGGGVLEQMQNVWPNIIGKAQEGLSSLFEGLGGPVNEFMGSVRSLFGEFGRGKPLMGGVRDIITSVFSTLFSWATKAVTVVHMAFLYVAIGALTAYIAMRPAINAIKEFVTSANFLRGVKVLLAILAVPFVLLGMVIGVVVVVIGTMVAVVGVLASALTAITGAIVYAIGAIADFASDALAALGAWVVGAAAAAADFVSGLVQGISAGAGAVVDAVKGLASGALGAFTGIFGIKSPSRVMLEHGEDNIAGAAATGIDKGAGKVDDAMARLGSGEKGGGGKASAGDGGEKHYHFHYEGGSVGEYEKFREYVARFMEETDGEAPTFA